jgi:hypothetical protein
LFAASESTFNFLIWIEDPINRHAEDSDEELFKLRVYATKTRLEI